MTKIQKLAAIVTEKLREINEERVLAQRTGNPHLSTKYTGAASAYIAVLEEIKKLTKGKQ